MPFLYCCKTAKVWRARISLQRKDYKIRLVRNLNENRCCGCCEQYKVIVNKRQVEHSIKYTPCSLLCGYGRHYEYEWKQDGHTFLFVLNTASFTSPSGKHRLYVNGIDVSSGKEYSEFWNRRGWHLAYIGLFVIVLTFITTSYLIDACGMAVTKGLVTSAYVQHCKLVFLFCMFSSFILGCLLLLCGLVFIAIYRRPRFEQDSKPGSPSTLPQNPTAMREILIQFDNPCHRSQET